MPLMRYVGIAQVDLIRRNGDRATLDPGDEIFLTPVEAAGCATLPEHPFGVWERVGEERKPVLPDPLHGVWGRSLE